MRPSLDAIMKKFGFKTSQEIVENLVIKQDRYRCADNYDELMFKYHFEPLLLQTALMKGIETKAQKFPNVSLIYSNQDKSFYLKTSNKCYSLDEYQTTWWVLGMKTVED